MSDTVTVSVPDATPSQPRPKVKPLVYIIAFIAALAGLLFGLDIGVISGALMFVGKEFNETTFQKEMVVSAILVGAVIGTFISGVLSRIFGRKTAILVSSIIFVGGAIGCALSVSTTMLIGFRLILGVGVGVASFTAPLYLSEMSPPSIRGALISCYQLMITIGIVLAFLSDAFFTPTGNWRMMLGIVSVPAAIMFIGVCFLPQSPRWLVLVGRIDEARRVLSRLRNDQQEVEREIADIKCAAPASGCSETGLLGNRNFRRVLMLGILLQLMQQFTGINIMMYYAPEIFHQAGFQSVSQRMWATVAVGTVNMLATFIAIALVDRVGRKPILYIGSLVMFAGMAAMGMMFHLGITSGFMQYLAIACVLTFIVGFSMSYGPVIWILCSEIYPLAGRDMGITVSTATNWICNAIIGATFLTIMEALGAAATFWMFGGLNLLFLFLVMAFAPETKGVSLEQIESNLMSGRSLRKIGK